MKNNLGSSFHSKKSKDNNNDDKSESDEDYIDEQEGEYSYQNFCKLKKQIFQYIENNSAAKEKKTSIPNDRCLNLLTCCYLSLKEGLKYIAVFQSQQSGYPVFDMSGWPLSLRNSLLWL